MAIQAPPETQKPGLDLVGQWTEFLSKMSTDQDLQQAVLGFGTQLLQSESGGGGAAFLGDVGQAFGSSKQFLEQRRAATSAAEQAKIDKELERTKTAGDISQQGVTRELDVARTEKTQAETEAIKKGKGGRAASESDLTRRADALAAVDPSINSRDEAIVFLEDQKGKITREKFMADFLTRNAILGVSAVDAAKAWTDFENAVESTDEGAGEGGDITFDQVRARYPGATEQQIQKVLTDPKALARFKSITSRAQ